jgi:protein SCO1/2
MVITTQSPRPRPIAIAALVVILLALAGCAGDVPRPPDSVGTPLNQPVPDRIATLPLVNSAGKRVDLADFRGKVLVISDMMTLCQETCPLDTANIVATAQQVEKAGLGDKVEFLSITIDPARDDAAHLAAYRKLFSSAPADWEVIGGSAASLHALWRYLGLYYERVAEDSPPATDWLTGTTLGYDIDHADLVYFFGTGGAERYTVDGTAHVSSASRLPARLRQFLSDEGRQNLTHPGFGSWTVGQALEVIGWLTDTWIPGAAAPTASSSPVLG